MKESNKKIIIDSGLKKHIATFLSESILVIIGQGLISVITQFLIYPLWNQYYDNDGNGYILFLMSGMSIYSITIGMACNYGRMKMSAYGETRNNAYNFILLIASLLALPFSVVLYFISNLDSFNVLDIILFTLLTILTMVRLYSDVEYRLTLNYKRCFIFYLFICIGYIFGMYLFRLTKIWQLALIPGEIFGIIYVLLKGTVLRIESEKETKENTKVAISTVMVLISTDLVSSLVFNGDRILLKFAVGATAVTIYYQASVLGRAMSLITAPVNSVLIGYLSKYKKNLSYSFMNIVCLILLALSLVATIIFTIGSHILVKILYPQNYELVKGYFLIAVAAQVVGCVSGIAVNILLRFCKVKYLVNVNLVFLAVFVVLCVPGAMLGDLMGFSIMFFIVCLLRLCYTLALGYYNVYIINEKKNKKRVDYHE